MTFYFLDIERNLLTCPLRIGHVKLSSTIGMEPDFILPHFIAFGVSIGEVLAIFEDEFFGSFDFEFWDSLFELYDLAGT